MLLSLSLINFVLAENLEIEFSKGFGVLTGETGAGKSLLFDALQFVTGKRADTSLIREGANKSEISAVFTLPSTVSTQEKIINFFEEWAINYQNNLETTKTIEILLRRIIEVGGRSKSFINGSQVTLAQLSQIGELLLDIHGQHDSTLMMKPTVQREMLDEFAKQSEFAKNVNINFKIWQEFVVELNNARNNQSQLEEQREILQLKLSDLKNVKSAGEWEELDRKHNRLTHLQTLQENCSKLINILDEDEASIDNSFNSAVHTLVDMKNIDEGLADILELINSAQNESREAVRSLRNYLEKLEGDPDTLIALEREVGLQMELARRYRCKPEDLAKIRSDTEINLNNLINNLDISALEKKVNIAKENYYKLAQELSKIREKAGLQLANEVTKNLPALGMKAGKFYTNIEKSEPSAGGLETIEFQVSGLAGNTARAIAKVASGGELSRLSLALHIAIHSSAAKVYLFDEIDAGIGGGVATAVGKMLKQLAKQNPEGQILGVTHLAQVACHANWHGVVEKSFTEHQNKLIAKSTIRLLNNKNERVAEIARMLGGDQITQATINHAEEMLQSSN